MLTRIFTVIFMGIVLLLIYNWMCVESGNESTEGFISNSSSNSNKILNMGTKTQNNRNINSIQNSLGSKTNKQNEQDIQQQAQIDEKILFNNRDYNENLSIDNQIDGHYYYNDMINQSNINETAFNIVNSIDPIDYSNVKTGLEKCEENCNGMCYSGYNGISTCYAPETSTFDFGTIYKNPFYTYSSNAYNPEFHR